MLSLRRPTDDEIRRFLAVQRDLPLSYPEVGASREGPPPAGYPINHYRGELGQGEEVYARAVTALRSWAMYELDWTTLCWPSVPVEAGAVVAVVGRHLGLWSLNACRVVYTFEEGGRRRRSGFAIGTLPGHVEQGEERFTIELDSKSGAVWYELFAFARPNALLAKLGSPLARRIQKRFAAASSRAMKAAVTTANSLGAASP